MKKRLKKWLNAPAANRQKEAARKQLKALHGTLEGPSASVVEALLAALEETFEPKAKERITAIELRRSQLASDRRELTIMDYGAGRPDEQLSEEAMRAGREVRLEVSRLCGASKSPFWANLLHQVIRKCQPKRCLEMGSCVGISAAYQALALELNGEDGALLSLEGSEVIADIARETWELSQLKNVTVMVGSFQENYGAAVAQMAPIDYLFNDGHHDPDATIHYFEEALPCLAEEAVVILDDIRNYQDMRRAWDHVCAHPRVCLAIDLHTVGIVQLGASANTQVHEIDLSKVT